MSEEVRRDTRGRWLPGKSPNPRGRPSTGESVRRLLDPHKEDLINKAVELALDGNVQALKICIDRISPPVKEECTISEITGLRDEITFAGKGVHILNAVSRSELTVEAGLKLLKALGIVVRIKESTELESRVQLLEDMSEGLIS